MKRYQRILVCVEDMERGRRMLGYIGAIARRAETRELHLLHVRAEPAHPTSETAPAPAADAILPEGLRDCASEHFEGHGDESVIGAVVVGSPLLEILRYAHEKDIDLIVVGRRAIGIEAPEHEALLSRRLTRKATCSVLVLPEDAPVQNRRIVVPVRDSDCSANALSIAVEIAAATNAELMCLNVFQVHSGYSRVGASLEEHEAILAENAERECDRLLRRVEHEDVSPRTKCVPDLHDDPVPIILECVRSEAADLVVIGARGRSGAAGVLLGNVTERLIQRCPVPLLAVKKKGESVGVVRALLTIAGQD